MKDETMRIAIDKAKCIGSGNCVLVAPDVFTLNDDGIVEVLVASPPPEQRDVVEAAMRACPTVSIIEDRIRRFGRYRSEGVRQ